MKILVDENIPTMTVRALRAMGHDVRDVRGTTREGMSDRRLWDLAQDEGRLLVTTDKGFASRRHEPHQGLLVVRLRQPNRLRIHERVVRAFAHVGPSEWPGRLVIVRDVAVTAWPPQIRTE